MFVTKLLATDDTSQQIWRSLRKGALLVNDSGIDSGIVHKKHTDGLSVCQACRESQAHRIAFTI
jgi:hypothetical protein